MPLRFGEDSRSMTRGDHEKHVQKAYALPEIAQGGLSWEEHRDDIRMLDDWLKDAGVSTKNTRIVRYLKFLELICAGDENPDSVFSDPDGHPFDSTMDRIMYVLREVHELMWIRDALSGLSIPGISEKLKVVVSGADFAALDKRSASRDTQFELRIASYFARGGYDVDLSTDTDVIARSRRETFYIECKRVGSAKQLQRRCREAADQLTRRMPKSRIGNRFHGVVAADVTKVAYPHNGMTFGVTADHSRDILRDALVSASDHLDAEKIWSGKVPILIWLQIHIPAVIQNPPQTVTRFSTYGIANPRVGWAGRRALNRVVALWPQGIDPAMSGPDLQWPLKQTWTIPAGTTFWWSQALEDWLSSGVLPDSPDDEVAGELISDRTETFAFAELKQVAVQPEAVEILERSKLDLPAAALQVLAMMHIARNRYEPTEPNSLD